MKTLVISVIVAFCVLLSQADEISKENIPAVLHGLLNQVSDAATRSDSNGIQLYLLSGKNILLELQPKITDEKSLEVVNDVIKDIDNLIEQASKDITDLKSIDAFVDDARDKLDKFQKSQA